MNDPIIGHRHIPIKPSPSGCAACVALFEGVNPPLDDESTTAVSCSVYLVVMDTGGLFGTYLDRDRAFRNAESICGVVAELPIAADYRLPVVSPGEQP